MNPSRTGDRAAAWAASASVEARALAIAALKRDKFAASSAAPRDPLARTWLAIHTSWFGPGAEALPLTPAKLEGVMAALKAGGYRSAANYASRAKEPHVLAGHPWTDSLALALKHAVASTKRGIGPARQSAPLPLEDVAKLNCGDQAMVAGGPCAVGHMVIAGSFFCTQEIEISLARKGHVTVDHVCGTVTWNPPASKCDPEALGKSRTLRLRMRAGGGCAVPVLRAGQAGRVARRHVRGRPPRRRRAAIPDGHRGDRRQMRSRRVVRGGGQSAWPAHPQQQRRPALRGRVTGARWLAGLGMPIA